MRVKMGGFEMELLLLVVGFAGGVIVGKLLPKDTAIDEYKRELARMYARKEFENAHKNST
jgi:hypothetical protein